MRCLAKAVKKGDNVGPRLIQAGQAVFVPALSPVLDTVQEYCKLACYLQQRKSLAQPHHGLSPYLGHVDDYGKCPWRAVCELPQGKPLQYWTQLELVGECPPWKNPANRQMLKTSSHLYGRQPSKMGPQPLMQMWLC